MIYLSRPLFDFIPQFVEPKQTVSDDATRDRQGYGAVTPWRVQELSQRVWKMSLLLEDRQTLRDLEAFFDARRGQVEGFWLPSWQGDYRLTSGISSTDTYFVAEPTGLPDVFDSHPGFEHVAFIDRSGNITPKAITGAVSNSPYESIAFDGTAGFDASAETQVSQLLYVRFASDELNVNYTHDGFASVEIEFVELPLEYAEAETGQRPIWLYEITQDGGSLFRWTSHGASVTAGGAEWEPRDITHTKITKGTDFFDEGVTLRTGINFSQHPLRSFLAGPPVNPLRVRIFKTTAPGYSLDLNAPVYDAEIRSVSFEERGVAVASLSSILRIAERPVPRVLVQPFCNWALFDGATCKLNADGFITIATLSGASSLWIESASFSNADANYYALGRVRFNGEYRLVTRQSGTRLYLNAPFSVQPTAGDTVNTWPGCDRKKSTCTSKFSNDANFGGFPDVPVRNPQLTAIKAPSPSTSGGKK